MWANRNSWQKLYDGEVITCRLLPYCRRWEWSAGLVYRSNCMTQFREWETNMGGQIPAGFNTSWVLLCMKSWDSQPFDKFLKKSVYDGETLSCFLACHFQVCPCLDVHWYLPFCLHIGLLLFVLCFSGQAFVSLCLSYIFFLHWFLCTAFPSVVCFLSVWLTHFSLTCPSLSRLRLCLFIPQTSACNSVYRHTVSDVAQLEAFCRTKLKASSRGAPESLRALTRRHETQIHISFTYIFRSSHYL